MTYTDDFAIAHSIALETPIFDVSDELYHFGRKGMKWGQHIFSMAKGGFKLHKSSKAAKKEAENLKSAKAKTQQNQDHQREEHKKAMTQEEATSIKNMAIRSGDPNMVRQYAHLMDNKEFKSAVERVASQQQLNQQYRKANPTMMDKYKKMTDGIGDIAEGIGKGVKLYNQGMAVKKAFDDLRKPQKGSNNTEGGNNQGGNQGGNNPGRQQAPPPQQQRRASTVSGTYDAHPNGSGSTRKGSYDQSHDDMFRDVKSNSYTSSRWQLPETSTARKRSTTEHYGPDDYTVEGTGRSKNSNAGRKQQKPAVDADFKEINNNRKKKK